jgi:hypothetical protein
MVVVRGVAVSYERSEEGSADSKEDVLLNQRKVAQI